MARTKEFDPDVALTAALDVFWRQGYAATSMDDLARQLGLGKQSIYATFGNKRELYLRALERYRAVNSADLVELLAGADPVLPAIRGVLMSFVDEALLDEDRRGCFLVNCAMERVPHDERAAREVRTAFDTVEDALTDALIRAQAGGEVPDDRSPRTLARFLLTSIQGLRVIGKTTPERARMADAVDTVMAALR